MVTKLYKRQRLSLPNDREQGQPPRQGKKGCGAEGALPRARTEGTGGKEHGYERGERCDMGDLYWAGLSSASFVCVGLDFFLVVVGACLLLMPGWIRCWLIVYVLRVSAEWRNGRCAGC